MKNIAVSDIHEVSRAWKYYLENNSSEYNVVAYVTKRSAPPQILDGIPVLCIEQFAALYKRGLIREFVLPQERYIGWSKIVEELISLEVQRNDIYIVGRMKEGNLKSKKPYDSAKYLPYLEAHVADHCNLNCRACEHFSGLVEKPVFHSAKNIYRDLYQLRQFIEDIGVIRILGGEPLLNPEISEIMRAIRRIYVDSDIWIVTNGLLLDRMPNCFFDTCVEYHIKIWISYYPPMIKRMDCLKATLEKHGVEYNISELNVTFRKKYILQPHNDKNGVFEKCFQATCHNLYEGKIGVCFLPFTQKYFNQKYNCDIPCDGAINLYESGLTTEKLKRFLLTPFERCKYCSEKAVNENWTTMKDTISDWIIYHEDCDEIYK